MKDIINMRLQQMGPIPPDRDMRVTYYSTYVRNRLVYNARIEDDDGHTIGNPMGYPKFDRLQEYIDMFLRHRGPSEDWHGYWNRSLREVKKAMAARRIRLGKRLDKQARHNFMLRRRHNEDF